MVKTRFVLATFVLLCVANFSLASPTVFSGDYSCNDLVGSPAPCSSGRANLQPFSLVIPVPGNGLIQIYMPEPAHDAGYGYYIAGDIPPYNFNFPNAGGNFAYYVGATLALGGILGPGGFENDYTYDETGSYQSPVIFDYVNGSIFADSCLGTCGGGFLAFQSAGGGIDGPYQERLIFQLPPPALTPEPSSWLYGLCAGVFAVFIFIRRS
jgi:hypothetical protein